MGAKKWITPDHRACRPPQTQRPNDSTRPDMIREGKKLPPDALKKIPALVEGISENPHVLALFIFGSGAKGALEPLSDLDFGLVLSFALSKKERFEEYLEVLGLFNQIFRSDEIDLVVMNDAPARFSHRIFKDGKLLFCRDRGTLANFYEVVLSRYLDFKFYREQFDDVFLKGVGYNG